MKRRSFLGLLGLLPVAIKAVVNKPAEPATEAGKFWMSDGTGSCSWQAVEYAGELRHMDSDMYQQIIKRVSETNPYAELFEPKKFLP